jgi:hypothetical protein
MVVIVIMVILLLLLIVVVVVIVIVIVVIIIIIIIITTTTTTTFTQPLPPIMTHQSINQSNLQSTYEESSDDCLVMGEARELVLGEASGSGVLGLAA